MATEKDFDVAGMDCSGCENRVKTALARVEGIIKADADYQTGRVAVRFDANRVSEDDLKERIRAAGYEIA